MAVTAGTISRGVATGISSVAVLLLLLLVATPTESVIGTQILSFFRVSLVLAVCSLFYIFMVKSPNRLTVEDALAGALTLSLTLNYWFVSPLTVPDSYWEYLFLGGVYVSLRILLPGNRVAGFAVLLAVLGVGCYETWLGLRQALGTAYSKHALYPVTGTFFNPGPFGGYLAAVMSVALAYCLFNYERARELWDDFIAHRISVNAIFHALLYAAALFVFVCGFVIFFAVFSRAAILALFISAAVCLLCYGPFRRRAAQIVRFNRKGIWIAAVCLAVVAGSFAALYYAKKGSADGRMQIFRVSTRMVEKNPLTGSGFGTFGGEFASAQADYFRRNPDAPGKMVAGAPEYAFNEYMLTAAELGLPALGLLLALLSVALVNLLRRRDPYAFGLLALMVFAFFSYPFSILPLKILLVLCVASSANARIAMRGGRRPSKLLLAPSLGAVIVVMAMVGPQFEKKVKVSEDWRQVKSMYYDLDYSLGEMALCYPWLVDDHAFLFEYGRVLHMAGRYRNSNSVLTEGAALSSDPMFYNVMGNNYKAMGRYAMAEEAYQKAFDILPNRMYPKYLLMNLYAETDKPLKASRTASEILGFDVKIESSAVEEMRQRAQNTLDSIKNTYSHR